MIKNKCLSNKINLIDAGHKGVLIGFKNNFFKNTDKLFEWISKSSGQLKIRPDQKLFYQKDLKTKDQKVELVLNIIDKLEKINF